MPARIPFRPVDQFEGKSPAELERSSFYNGARWRTLRKRYLKRYPLCQVCKREFADTVHHVKARLDYPWLAYAWDNFQAMCAPCHSAHEISLRRRESAAPDDPTRATQRPGILPTPPGTG